MEASTFLWVLGIDFWFLGVCAKRLLSALLATGPGSYCNVDVSLTNSPRVLVDKFPNRTCTGQVSMVGCSRWVITAFGRNSRPS